jgi:hypothetical protein
MPKVFTTPTLLLCKEGGQVRYHLSVELRLEPVFKVPLKLLSGFARYRRILSFASWNELRRMHCLLRRNNGAASMTPSRLYTYQHSNGHKASMMMEEIEPPFEVHVGDISNGYQKQPAHLTIDLSKKILVVVDPDAGRTVVNRGHVKLRGSLHRSPGDRWRELAAEAAPYSCGAVRLIPTGPAFTPKPAGGRSTPVHFRCVEVLSRAR